VPVQGLLQGCITRHLDLVPLKHHASFWALHEQNSCQCEACFMMWCVGYLFRSAWDSVKNRSKSRCETVWPVLRRRRPTCSSSSSSSWRRRSIGLRRRPPPLSLQWHRPTSETSSSTDSDDVSVSRLSTSLYVHALHRTNDSSLLSRNIDVLQGPTVTWGQFRKDVGLTYNGRSWSCWAL